MTWSRFAAVSAGYLALVTVVAAVVACVKDIYPHYTIFVHAAGELFGGKDPFGHGMGGPGDFLTQWYYSPTAALLFLPFVGMKPWVGQAIYLWLSIALATSGFLKLMRVLRVAPLLAFFYWILSSEVVGSIHQVRLEIATVGALFWVLAWTIEGRRPWLAGGLLAFTACWKFQTYPTLGLLSVALLLTAPRGYAFRFLGGAVACLVVSYGWPWLYFPLETAKALHASWSTSLQAAVAATWKGYQSLPAVVHGWTGWPDSPESVFRIGAAAGAFFLAVTLWTSRTAKTAILVAVALGTVHTTLFSPMSQGSAYILATPALLAVFVLRPSRDRLVLAALWFHWFVTSLVHSDLVPMSWRSWAYDHRVRPLGFFVLTILLVALVAKRPRPAKDLLTKPLPA